MSSESHNVTGCLRLSWR